MNTGGTLGRLHGNDACIELNDLEGLTARVLGVFAEVLGLDDVAEDDDFFDVCGGTSIQAWWAVTEIVALTGAGMELKEFLRSPNARDTAALLFGMFPARAP